MDSQYRTSIFNGSHTIDAVLKQEERATSLTLAVDHCTPDNVDIIVACRQARIFIRRIRRSEFGTDQLKQLRDVHRVKNAPPTTVAETLHADIVKKDEYG